MKKKQTMQLSSLILFFLVLFAFAGCSNADFEAQTPEINTQVNQLFKNAKVVSKLQTRNAVYLNLQLQKNIKMYRANQTSTIDCAALRNTPFQNEDWGNALYFWDKPNKGYLDSDHPFFIEVSLTKALNVIYTEEPSFMDGSYDMNQVVANVEKLIGSKKPAGTPFLYWLGQKGYAFYYYENLDKEMAIVVPHALLADDLFSQKVTDTLK